MRSWRGWTLVLASAMAAAPALYLAVALVLERVPLNGGFRAAGEGVPIGVYSNGVHAELLLPVRAAGIDWRDTFRLDAFPRLDANAAPPDVISVGWGHREFYLETPTWADVRPLTALKAVLGLGGSLLHVAYWPPLAEDDASAWTVVPVATYRRLAAYVNASLARDSKGRPRWIEGAAYTDNDAFFAAVGDYGPILTCNEWVGRALAAAGVRTGLWTPFPGAILDHLRAVPAR
jgi:uncharacterized protein (TIGR02117 family)